MIEELFAGQQERVRRDDLIKDLAGERGRTRRRKRCQQQEEEAEPQGHSTYAAHSHPDHTSVLLSATAAKLDFFSPRLGILAAAEGVGPSRTGSRKCLVEQLSRI